MNEYIKKTANNYYLAHTGLSLSQEAIEVIDGEMIKTLSDFYDADLIELNQTEKDAFEYALELQEDIDRRYADEQENSINSTKHIKIHAQSPETWLRLLYEVIAIADLSEEDGSQDDANTVMAWIAEEFDIDLKNIDDDPYVQTYDHLNQT